MAQHKDGSVGERDGLEEEEIEGLSDEEGGLHIDDIYIPPPTKPACSVESIGPRLIITKIVNDFFKSYAHEEILGPFHQRFNAIIGPNGSGKSNVIDSMLFVFGYRASKIRSKKISVLLHNSERFKNTQSCTVSVHFALIVDKEGDDYDIVPNSEFVVTRTANKDNSSFYQLDGKRVQFKEVARLLKHHGVDLDHNRFLILQGEVEQISLMKPKAQNEHETGMLEYLEDIIGTSRYKVPLAKLEDRVEVLSEQRTEKLNRVKLVQKDLEELKGPMQEAVEYLRVENLVAEYKNVLFQKYIVDLNAQMVEKKALETEIVGAQQEITEKIKELVKEIKTKEDQMRTESKKYESLEEKRNSMKTAFDVATNRDSQLQADMTQINKTRKKTKQLLAEEKQKLEKLERVPEENARAIEQCETKEQQMTAKKEKLDADRMKVAANIRAQTQDLQDKKDQLLTELMQLNEAVDTAKASFTMAESELQMYLSNETAEATKLQNLKSDHEECEQLINERTESVKELKKKIPATEKSLAEAKQELATLKGEESRLIDDLRHKRMNLEQTRSSMQATRSRGRVLDSLVQQKREGKCPGLFGRLGDLGAIDQKFDVAVSTACGPLDHIVVDTVATAQWCIEFLKKHDIGRASFIALDKQEHLRDQANGKINTPENVPRLFDLIRIEDERVKTAFYFALRNTLVATDLDQASRIAYGAQRFRVVTLNGDLIETAGTMSGGGKNVSRGRMGQSVAVSNINQGDFEQLEAELLELETRIKELRVRQNALENSINYLDPELRQMKIDYEKFSSELESLKQQQPLLIRKLKDQEAKCKSTKANPQEVQRLRDVLDKKRAEYDEASELASGLQAEVDAVTKAIEDKTIGKLKILDKDIKEAVAVIGKCKKEITRLNVAIKTSERNVRISNEKIATFEQDIGKCESDLLAMKAEREVIEEEARKLLVCIEELSEELAKKEEGCSEIKQEVDKIKKKENKLKLEKVEIDEKVKNITHATKDIASNINRWNAKIKQLTLQEIPEETTEPLKTFTEDELKSKDTQHVELELQAAEERLKQNKPNFSAIQQFHKKRDEYIAKSKELDEISEKKRQMRDMYETVRTKRREEFLIGYNIIRMKLKEMYQMITLGGDANFDLVDTFDPFNEGVQFNVRPPKKSWKVISNLSGGEKTLSSLALVFALHYYKPSPLYVMDEIDAALDFKNVSIVGHYIKERTKNAQFIIISLRSNMFELCDNLIGIYKVFSCTRSATIDPRKFENVVETQHVPDAQQHVPETQQHVPETQHVPEVTNDVPEVANDLNNSDSIVQSDEDESVDEQMDVSS